MNPKKTDIHQLLYSLLMAGFLIPGTSVPARLISPVPLLYTAMSMAGALLLLCLLPGNAAASGDQRCGIQKEIWSRYIQGALFKYNAWMNFAFNADAHVLAGKIVYIPQSGSTASVQKNRSSLPATVTRRTDTTVSYELFELTTDPRLIPNADTAELSYDKLDSVMTEDMQALRQTMAENLLIAWAPGTNIVRTGGDATPAHLPGATGNRKKARPADLQAAMTLMNRQDVPPEERYALVSADMYDQLIGQLSESQYRDFSRAFDEQTGVMGQLYGFRIVMRSSVLTYNNAATPAVKAYGDATAASDNDAILCWQKQAVERALGEVRIFNKDNDPQYYGDLFSFLLRGGGRIRREDERGVAAIVQAASS